MPRGKTEMTKTASSPSRVWNSARIWGTAGAIMDEAICPTAARRLTLSTMATFLASGHCNGS